MTWRNHPRRLTNENHARWTTIDGNRIDRAMAEVVDTFNSIPKGDVKSRFVQSQFHMGWLPRPCEQHKSPAGFQETWPWMQAIGGGQSSVSVAPVPLPADYTNQQRAKGFAGPLINPVDGTDQEWHYLFEASWAFSRPVIIESIDMMMLVDGGTAPAGAGWYSHSRQFTAGPVDLTDVTLHILVDSEFDKENRAQADQEVIKRGFRLTLESVGYEQPTIATGPTPNTDMTWAYPGGEVGGVYVPMRLNVPIHRDARVRFQMTIPYYGGRASGWDDSVGTPVPWYKTGWESTVTILEEVERG